MKKLLLLLFGFAIGFLVCYFFSNKASSYDAMVTPKGIIKPAEAIKLDVAYNTRHQLISDSIVGKPDNRSSWWSLSDLEGFVSHAKNQADSLKYDLNGFRMYMGAHPIVKGQAGYTTIFIVPTGVPVLLKGTSGFAPPTGNGDIPGADGLNDSANGNPPAASYPQ